MMKTAHKLSPFNCLVIRINSTKFGKFDIIITREQPYLSTELSLYFSHLPQATI
ncbi:Uncharacterised protein [Legionella londiniensis]|uniref:Uncharacterized protein n=1 Tax=Legionella londiniensis TaxID=45068 RepID=A0A0W0VRL7_9GAMM|nr:hypothetical protein Llon_0611 [Legionella londiniensis]STX93033.1 Uncharacterised protein [Legionella londiniensis]